MPPRKLISIGRKVDPEWSYKMDHPLIPLDQVTLHSVPEAIGYECLVEFRLIYPAEETEIMYFKCEDSKHKKDLLQQFRLIKKEACPDCQVLWNWRYKSDKRETPSAEEMLVKELLEKKSLQLNMRQPKKKPCDLIKITQATSEMKATEDAC